MILTVLKIGLAGLLIWFVLNQIETQDRLQVPVVSETETYKSVYGEYQGDWRADPWAFTAEDGAEYSGNQSDDYILQPGFFTAMRSLKIRWYLLGVALWGALLIFAAQRWRMLLGAAGVSVSYRESFRLTIIGYFFNNVMLGSTGGDLVRAVMVTRTVEQNRMRAAISVIVDRLIGLFALMLIAGTVLSMFWFAHRISEVRGLRMVTGTVYLLLFIAIVGSAIYLSRRARKSLGVDWVLSKLPAQALIQKLDDAITIYRDHKRTVFGALLISIPLQVCGILSFWAIGVALGSRLTLMEDFVIFPVVQTVSALPLAPAGWGVGETLFGTFFRSFGSSFTLGVAVSVLFRLTSQVGYGLIGGLIWATSKERRQGISMQDKKS
ncbi:MAG: lysylphosphatidylglycerol synthase transmembrane domain-containing protein [Planctomycetota bacterium]|nr:lysylphosphatidylglycerol synthase transmembrane domain-containing protein [Planctomycetota bacterium]MDA1114136.1 lysylphosphatidylglycerol synthase transmembrane domain-containing protein [Planctomycetota bacterium]